MKMRGRGLDPHQRYSAIAAVLVAAGTAGGLYARVPAAAAALGALNLAAGLLVLWDKRIAGTGALRVPERLFFLLAALGASPGLGLCLLAFRHKTRKRAFLRVYWAVVLLQVAALVGWAVLVRGR